MRHWTMLWTSCSQRWVVGCVGAVECHTKHTKCVCDRCWFSIDRLSMQGTMSCVQRQPYYCRGSFNIAGCLTQPQNKGFLKQTHMHHAVCAASLPPFS